MTEYSGAKAPSKPRDFCLCLHYVHTFCPSCDAIERAMRAQAEKDAEIAGSHDVCAGEAPCDCNKIAAAIRIAAPKEGS